MISRFKQSGGLGAIALGDRARDAGAWEAAVLHYRAALSRNPNNAPIWVQYGHALKESGRLTEAEIAYRHALDVADTHLQLGVEAKHVVPSCDGWQAAEG